MDVLVGGEGVEFSYCFVDPGFVRNNEKMACFFLVESLESVDICLCLIGTAAACGIGDWAIDDGVFRISESCDFVRSRGGRVMRARDGAGVDTCPESGTREGCGGEGLDGNG